MLIAETISRAPYAICNEFGPAPVRHDVDGTAQIADAAPLKHAKGRWLSGAEWAVQAPNPRRAAHLRSPRLLLS